MNMFVLSRYFSLFSPLVGGGGLGGGHGGGCSPSRLRRSHSNMREPRARIASLGGGAPGEQQLLGRQLAEAALGLARRRRRLWRREVGGGPGPRAGGADVGVAQGASAR